jgi:23S rRNA pseudouridine2605 synthase
MPKLNASAYHLAPLAPCLIQANFLPLHFISKTAMSKHRNNRTNKPKKESASFRDQPKKIIERAEVEGMRLNKYVAHCGICSRRQAADYIKEGLVTVNGEILDRPGYQIQKDDVVAYQGEVIKPEENLIYILMNKPRNVITTVKDEMGRKTVMDIIGPKVKERIFPVGRLDKDTTGLLLLTNDGHLAKKLTHPSHGVKKFYQAQLDKPLTKKHLEEIRKGLTLEDGPAMVDFADYVEGKDANEVGIEIHIGRNRIVRRIFEHLGYTVERLDRVYMAGLTKKDLPRSFFRHLTEREVIMLKHFT